MNLEDLFAPEKKKWTRGERIIAAVAVVVILAMIYGLMWLRCEAWNHATGDNLTVWEWLWLPTRYTGPQ